MCTGHGMRDLDLDLQGLGGLAPLGNMQGVHWSSLAWGMFFQLDLMCCFFPVTWDLLVLLETMCTLTGPPPGANMGMGMMNPDMMGMMQQHDLGMGFDLSQGGPQGGF